MSDLCVIKTRPRVNSETCRPYALLEISEPGRPPMVLEIRRLIRTMACDGWGAPRIHAEGSWGDERSFAELPELKAELIAAFNEYAQGL